jgi:acyl-CoA hydrolase
MLSDWQEEYKKKFITADEAAAFVKDGDTIVFTQGREAFAIGFAIASRKEELKNVTVIVPTPTYDFGWYDEGWQDSFMIRIGYPTGTCQEALDKKRIHLSPAPIASALMSSPDIVITEISSPDERGFCSFGQSLWNKKRQGKLSLPKLTRN